MNINSLVGNLIFHLLWQEGMNPYTGARAHIGSRDDAAALWEASETMTGVAFSG